MARKTISSLEYQIAYLRKQLDEVQQLNRDLLPQGVYDRKEEIELVKEFSLRPAERWFGQHRNIGYEVVRFPLHMEPGDSRKFNWNAYLYFSIDKVPVEYSDSLNLPPEPNKYTKFSYDYSRINIDEGTNGGLTWYSKEYNNTVIKMGWDYNHLWDSERGVDYTLRHILYDCRAAIDSLLTNYPLLEISTDTKNVVVS